MSRYHFFSVPIDDDGSAAEALNRFLAGHAVAAIDKRFIEAGAASAWAFCVTVAAVEAATNPPRRSGIDYREVLDGPQFQHFARLRQRLPGGRSVRRVSGRSGFSRDRRWGFWRGRSRLKPLLRGEWR